MSRDGSRAHAYANDGKVHTYDLTQFPPVDMNGGIVVADPGTGPSDVNTRMAISPDGRTLFLAGSTQIVVVPLP